MLNRVLVAATVIGAVSLAGASVTANAPQPPQQEQKTLSDSQKPDPKKPKEQKPEQKPKPGQQAKPVKQKPNQQARPAQPQAQPRPLPARPQQQVSPTQPQRAQARLAPQQQQQRIGEHQQELVQYRDQLDQQQRLAPQQGVELQRQHRTAQYAYQQQYVAGLNQQRASIQDGDSYNYGGDPYFYTPPSYRYARDGRYYETNEYGADVLRQAVNNGYAQGLGAGRADRRIAGRTTTGIRTPTRMGSTDIVASTSRATTTATTSARASAAATTMGTTGGIGTACMRPAASPSSVACCR